MLEVRVFNQQIRIVVEGAEVATFAFKNKYYKWFLRLMQASSRESRSVYYVYQKVSRIT